MRWRKPGGGGLVYCARRSVQGIVQGVHALATAAAVAAKMSGSRAREINQGAKREGGGDAARAFASLLMACRRRPRHDRSVGRSRPALELAESAAEPSRKFVNQFWASRRALYQTEVD